MSMGPDLAYHQVSIALQQNGLTLDEYMKMYRSPSSQHSSKPSRKRKSMVAHEPRSVSASAFAPTQPLSMHEISLATTEMNRRHGVSVQSAPAAAAALSRSTSRKSISTYPPRAPAWHNGVMSSVNHDDTPLMRNVSQHIDGTWQDPEDYLANVNVIDTTIQPLPNYTTMSIPEQSFFDPELLSATSTHFAWSPVPGSALNSPRYSIDYTDLSSLPSTNMSREQTRSSLSSFFTDLPLTDDFGMLRVKSEASHMSPSDSQSRHPAPIGTVAHYPYSHHQFVPDQHHSPSTTYVNAHHTSLESPSAAFNFISATEGLPAGQPYNAPYMHRDLSSSSSSSNSSSISRSHKRHRETVQPSQCSIASALNHHSSSSSNKNEHNHQQLKSEQMVRVTSENGEEKVLIPKNIERQKRPTPPKLLCPSCSDHPDGFRGEHELHRHVMRAHAKIRKVWICVDSSPDNKFLSNCKACRTKKRYGAYYNAAAHLRRAHFNPRKKGRRPKGEEHEKRGGKGGGHWPPMDDLKVNWMREIEEMVPDDAPPLADDVDADAGEDIDIHQADDPAITDNTNISPINPNSLNYTDTSFNSISPMFTTYSPVFAGEMNMNITNVNFTDMMTHCEDDLMSQAAGMYSGGDMSYSGSQSYLPQQAGAYDPLMGGQM